MKLQPFDIVSIDSLWYMPHHWLIRQRGAGDKGVHNCIVLDSSGAIENVDFIHGLRVDHIDRYKGRCITIHRYVSEFTTLQSALLKRWLRETRAKNKGYDFGQILAAYFGIASEDYKNDNTRWSCSERSYFAFADNSIIINPTNEALPHPRWVRHSRDFETVFEGVWNG